MIGDPNYMMDTSYIEDITVNTSDIQLRETNGVLTDWDIDRVQLLNIDDDDSSRHVPCHSVSNNVIEVYTPTEGDMAFNGPDDSSEDDDMPPAMPVSDHNAPVQGPVSVLVYGDSFVRRINEHLTSRYGPFHNF